MSQDKVSITPGPWSISRTFTHIRAGDCILGCQIWSEHWRVAFTEQQNVGTLVELANAYLIAAAPELLEVVKKLEWINGVCIMCGRTEVEGHNSVCSLAGVIAKAEGEEEEKE